MDHPKIIFGILVKERASDAILIQEVFSKFGYNIKTRIGLHDADGYRCSSHGIILLEMVGSIEEIIDFEKEMKKIPDIEMQKMIF